MFADGELFLDASIVLPLMAEELLDPSERRFQTTTGAALESGLRLRITPGVLEELERHINLCRICWRHTGDWRASIPFLLGMYVASGRQLRAFDKWLETFAGADRPEEDIAEFIEEQYGIEVEELESDAHQVEETVRLRIQECWRAGHEARRGDTADADLTARLASHDAENYLGVIHRRHRSKRGSPFGHTSWWVTTDRVAYEVGDKVRAEFGTDAPSYPVMSPDFLVNYLAFGRVRRSVGKPLEQKLPILLDLKFPEVPKEFLDIAERIRTEADGLPERIVRRRVRDAFDREKQRRGRLAQGGPRLVERDLTEQIIQEAERHKDR